MGSLTRPEQYNYCCKHAWRTTMSREGSLEAPTRHPLQWQEAEFYDEDKLNEELERVFDICHGCRRCVSLCNSFPTLFDLIDESETMELDGVEKQDYMTVVDHCYLCDLCYLTKCPYVPPHEWAIDYPHLMLRAKVVKHQKQKPGLRDRILSSTDMMGKFMGIPVISQIGNAANQNALARKLLENTLGIHQNATVPVYHTRTFRKEYNNNNTEMPVQVAGKTKGKVAIFATCYGNYNAPHLNSDLVKVFEHNGLPTTIATSEKCCGMPKLELGDLESVAAAEEFNIPILAKMIDEGWDIVGPVPSCILMFKQELPLMFPDDEDVAKVRDHIFDPFEYLMLRHKHGLLNTDFRQTLGKIAYHAACHLRVQKIGLKTRELLSLIPDTEIDTIERCSGHDGTYAVKKEYHDISTKKCRPVVTRAQKAEADYYASDCPMAGEQIVNGMKEQQEATHPLTLLRMAYGL
jgi:Fe-S oxidoreductase